jgi:Protein of unknown function (DUF3102)
MNTLGNLPALRLVGANDSTVLPEHRRRATNSVRVLTEHATEIRRLGKRVKEDVVEIGHRLVLAQEHVGHGRWLDWIETEFGWSDQTARRFIHIYEFSRDSRFNNLLNSELPLSCLYKLAAPSTPEEARQEIASRVEAGGQPSCAEVNEVIRQAKNINVETEDGIKGHDGDATIRETVLLEHYSQASGSNIYDWIPAARRNEVCRDFLDKLTADGMLKSMSESFGEDLRAHLPTKRKQYSHTRLRYRFDAQGKRIHDGEVHK